MILQASGPQVQAASTPLGVSIQTQVTTLPSGARDYACDITDSNRRYDNESVEIFGPGFFILELAVTQQVLVQSSDNDNVALSDEQIYDLVKTGFGRGSGGRVRFRSLLQRESSGFGTVLNVEVLPGTLSPPQAPPSAADRFARPPPTQNGTAAATTPPPRAA